MTNGKARTYNVRTYECNTIDYTDVFKYKKYYTMFQGYETSDDGLMKFSIDFQSWVRELKTNKIFKYDYLAYKSHGTAIIGLFTKLCYEKLQDLELDDINDVEFEWIEACNNASLTYCKKGKHQCHGYDYKLTYPSILASEHFHIPTKRGLQRTLKELPQYPDVGFYKVKITSNDERFNKIFNYSAKHVYTNLSLRFAIRCKEQGYKVDINLIDCDNNSYIYGKLDKQHCNVTGVVRSSNIFHKWFGVLTNLREELSNNKLIKVLASRLWGKLSEFNTFTKTIYELEKNKLDFTLEYDPKHEYYVRDITYNSKHQCNSYKLIETKKPYRHNMARIKPFLISKSRELVGAVAMEYIDDVVRIHTDNVTFNKKHDDVIESKSTKFIKLIKEEKTTGLITFKRVGCYRNHTNEKYTTKNYNNPDQDENDEDEFEE